jgi:hypothetical protein
MEEQDLFGKLFNTVPIYTEEHLDMILQTMNKDSATFFLIHAVKSAFDSGIYTIGETEVLSKCIRLLSKNDEKKLDDVETK